MRDELERCMSRGASRRERGQKRATGSRFFCVFVLARKHPQEARKVKTTCVLNSITEISRDSSDATDRTFSHIVARCTSLDHTIAARPVATAAHARNVRPCESLERGYTRMSRMQSKLTECVLQRTFFHASREILGESPARIEFFTCIYTYICFVHVSLSSWQRNLDDKKSGSLEKSLIDAE